MTAVFAITPRPDAGPVSPAATAPSGPLPNAARPVRRLRTIAPPILGALGTLRDNDATPGRGASGRLKALLAVMGPGLIVMVGDNDAGAFGIYTEAGQSFGTTLLWTLLLLAPVLYVNQEMALRLGAVTRVGHARLILERFGRFWGAFSVIDLVLLNALTIVTDFIGISLALDYLGLSRELGIAAAAVLVMTAAGTGDFRRFERFALTLVGGSLLLLPVCLMLHPPIDRLLQGLAVPHLPAGDRLPDFLPLIIGIVGTTVAPWQLFFQQSYVVDKRITTRVLGYARIDLMAGIILVTLGAVAIMAVSAAVMSDGGAVTDAAGIARGIEALAGRTAGVLFALALIDACMIGAAAVSLSTAYALGDVLSFRHSLHRKPSEARAFHGIHAGLVAFAALLVMAPEMPLGLLTDAVQTLAGVLLPGATVFLLLLCNDRALLGPWVNTRRLNLFTGAVVTALVMLSVLMTASALWPGLGDRTIIAGLAGGGIAALLLFLGLGRLDRGCRRTRRGEEVDRTLRAGWAMPALSSLPPPRLTLINRTWLIVLRAYLFLAAGLILARIVTLALTGEDL
ncbi:MAG: divalent metal cation transporter [Telmatospirillum sp.]|nr:divalent metal cation transporter [Telmatospirillum sp.]